MSQTNPLREEPLGVQREWKEVRTAANGGGEWGALIPGVPSPSLRLEEMGRKAERVETWPPKPLFSVGDIETSY